MPIQKLFVRKGTKSAFLCDLALYLLRACRMADIKKAHPRARFSFTTAG
jgi:hypothetical protein